MHSASIINSGVHSFQIFLGSQKLPCFFNFPITYASYKKLCDCYWLQLRITCKSGWIAQAEKRYCISKGGRSKVTAQRRTTPIVTLSAVLPFVTPCYPVLTFVTLFYPLLPCVTLCYPVLPCVPLCYLLLPFVTHLLACVTLCYPLLPLFTLCYSLSPCVILCYPVLPFVTPFYPVLPFITLCYPLLPCVPCVTLCYPLLPSVVLENNKEPRTYGCLAALTKIACFYVSKGVKENAKSDQRSNPVGQEQKPQKPIKMYA